MNRIARKLAGKANDTTARLRLKVVRERPALVVLNFHGVVQDEEVPGRRIMDPRHVITVGQFRQCVEYFLNHQYIPVALHDILSGLDPARAYFMLSFDDGYFNNTLALPLLESLQVPAMFAIVTDAMESGEAFWWDVFFRQRIAEEDSMAIIWQELDELARRPVCEIRHSLIERYGSEALRPVGDIDRPLTANELRDFVGHPLVHLANHTSGHDYLPACSTEQCENTITKAQEALHRIVGFKPEAIAYPYGKHVPKVDSICRRLGLKLGFTVEPRKIELPIDPGGENCLRLPRFPVVIGEDILVQCEQTRFDWKPSWTLNRLRESLYHPEPNLQVE